MDNINTQINDQMTNQQPTKEGLRSFVTSPKIVFVILGIVLLGELIYAARVLMLPSAAPFLPAAQTGGVQLTPGQISLIVPNTNIKVGDMILVSVVIDTGGHKINGVDLIVHYDPKVLEIASSGIIKGTILNEYPSMSVDSAKGLISISGIDNVNNSFNSNDLMTKGPLVPSSPFVTLNFKAKAIGRTSLSVDFKGKGSTTDSNLVEATTAKDILEKVNNLELTVK